MLFARNDCVKKSTGASSSTFSTQAPAQDARIRNSQFITKNGERIADHYQLDEELGKGSFGSVSKAANISNKAIRAVKKIAKSNVKNVEEEMIIMQMLDHPNIIKLYESFEDSRHLFLVMELCGGGELFEWIQEKKQFSEVQTAIVMQQILGAIDYMHKKKIAHRDVKPENFLFMTKDPIEKNVLKIIDFGFACKFTPDQALTSAVGTPYYVAPEVLAHNYDLQCDIWSCGVIMYVLLCGRLPFEGKTEEILAKVKRGEFQFDPADWKHVSDDAKSLILWLLKTNPHERYTAKQALNDEWMLNKASKVSRATEASGFCQSSGPESEVWRILRYALRTFRFVFAGL